MSGRSSHESEHEFGLIAVLDIGTTNFRFVLSLYSLVI